jgi:hypothetical protein
MSLMFDDRMKIAKRNKSRASYIHVCRKIKMKTRTGIFPIDHIPTSKNLIENPFVLRKAKLYHLGPFSPTGPGLYFYQNACAHHYYIHHIHNEKLTL